tara:strand:+ start:3070 stop:4527 length:1458 start_codon:yes stop_codon:yes gene_type:complete
MKKSIYYLSFFVLLIATSCQEEDYVDEAKGLVTQQQLQDLAASSPEAALTINVGVEDGQYAFMREFSTNFEQTGSRHDDFGQKSIDLGMDLLSNDMVQVQDHWFGNYYAYRGRTQDFSTTSIIWNFYYSIIRNVNSVIAQIPADATNEELVHLRARAMGLRAFSYFNLIRVYQGTYQSNQGSAGIPLYTGDVSIASRATVQEVYDVVLSDIEWAFQNISGFNRSTKEKLNKEVIAGIYARVLLETGTNWTLCAQMANVAKAGGTLISGSEYTDSGFDEISSAGWIWGSDIDNETSTIYASFFSHVGTNNPGYAGLLGIYKSIDRTLYDAIPATDVRKSAFGADYRNYKFEDATFFEGDYVYMRVAEMYLMEAEALARGGDDEGAAQALYSLVSTRDSGYALSSNTGQDLIDEILIQRRIELWGEGFAWFDMKRNNVALERDYAGSNHALFGNFNFPVGDNSFLFQIPESELNNSEFINAGDQNPL